MKSKYYVFWAEITFPDNFFTKKGIEYDSKEKIYYTSGTLDRPRGTLGVWFSELDFKFNAPSLAKNNPVFKHCKTFSQYIQISLEMYRKEMQKYFDKVSQYAPEEYRATFKVRYGRANSKSCPFYVWRSRIAKKLEEQEIFNSSVIKPIIINKKR